MKEPNRAINKDLCLREFFALNQIDYGSFITIPNPLEQFPVQNLITSEARIKLIGYKVLEGFKTASKLFG